MAEPIGGFWASPPPPVSVANFWELPTVVLESEITIVTILDQM